MVRKPSRMYRKVEGQVYTRTEYMGGIPHCRITQFDTGNVHQTYRFHFSLQTEEAANIQDKALEAARVSVVRVMDKVASNNFHVKVRKYPHAILREHKMATGAGADRISDGMRRAFGKPVGHAVRAQIGSTIITLGCRSENVPSAKEAMRKAASKLPVPVRVLVEEDSALVEGVRAAAVAPVLAAPTPVEAAPTEEKAEGASPEAAAPVGKGGKPAAGKETAAPAKPGAKPAAPAGAKPEAKPAPPAKKGK